MFMRKNASIIQRRVRKRKPLGLFNLPCFLSIEVGESCDCLWSSVINKHFTYELNLPIHRIFESQSVWTRKLQGICVVKIHLECQTQFEGKGDERGGKL